ncbi:MAG: diacylglycerol kinase family protein [Gammaproteobacteria bacterium]|nr:diacylglycerol kinase family protein [Gammaproteobacteria bacterium]
MNTENQFSFSGRIRSVGHAISGIKIVLFTQHNAWIHLAATLFVIVAGFYFSVTAAEWILLVVAVVMVWVAEALNTAFELLCDVASPEFHPVVKKSKDVAAGAVLVSAVGSIIVGTIVFLPYMLKIVHDQ